MIAGIFLTSLYLLSVAIAYKIGGRRGYNRAILDYEWDKAEDA